ncbi:MAG: glycosyltransferase [Ignavibacterium album]|uniref:glycosyltransferase family 2 protein n=1 Tax=Ignavibacterium album TaxID=591197 RepID=UPI0026EBBC89|nr:glycosyltransferase [Ignavibacterium album]MBI5663323.1 glycosyltransferase [Ignavibacterium album]
MKISVILPVYNAEKFISESIKSILFQSYTKFEFIIINDGSTDRTREIIESFSDPRIKFINKQNTGLVDTLNYGIRISSGELIARMDADDIALPNRFALQINQFRKNTAVLGGQFNILTEDGTIKKGKLLPLKHKNILKNLLNGKPAIIHPSVMINKEFLLKAGMYDEKMIAAEDHDLWLRISHLGNLSNVRFKVLCLRKHRKNISITHKDLQLINSLIANYYYNLTNDYRKIPEYEFNDLAVKVSSIIQKESLQSLIENFNFHKDNVKDQKGIHRIKYFLLNPTFIVLFYKIKRIKKKLFNNNSKLYINFDRCKLFLC